MMKKCNVCESEERFSTWFPRCGHHMCDDCYTKFVDSHHFDTYNKMPVVCAKCTSIKVKLPRIVTSVVFSRPSGSYIGGHHYYC